MEFVLVNFLAFFLALELLSSIMTIETRLLFSIFKNIKDTNHTHEMLKLIKIEISSKWVQLYQCNEIRP